MSGQIIYIFLDEGGNLDFSAKGSRFFSLSCISMQRPFALHTSLDNYKYDLIEFGLDTEYFHCTDDNTHVRRRVFTILKENQQQFHIDSLLVEKRKTHPALRVPQAFYPRMLGYLLRYTVKGYDHNIVTEVIVITDTIPLNKKRRTIEKSVKEVLRKMLPKDISYRVLHHASKAHYGLQVADYCNWAIFRKWEQADDEYYQVISSALKSEYDIFKNGDVTWY